jgi:futalosine hydrolase
MRVLVVAATDAEVADIAPESGDVDFLVTGVGMVATAAQTARALARTHYHLALNVGVCGSFDRTLPPGSIVHVVTDRIAELGAEDGDGFLALDELALPGEPVFVNAAPPANAALLRLPAVSGITVNTVHGSERSIEAVVRRFAPQVESMEGAAFMYACLINGVPFAQVRAVSNLVERRNRGAWRMSEAIDNLGRAALSILECI